MPCDLVAIGMSGIYGKNRGARGWQPPPKRPRYPSGTASVISHVDVLNHAGDAIDMVQLNGVWMTQEDADGRNRTAREAPRARAERPAG